MGAPELSENPKLEGWCLGTPEGGGSCCYFFLAAGPLLFICGDSHASWKTLGTETLLFPHRAHIFLGLLRAVILPAAHQVQMKASYP